MARIFQDFVVDKLIITCPEPIPIVANTRGFVTFRFTFLGSEWNGVDKKAFIETGGIVYESDIENDGTITDEGMPILREGLCFVSIAGDNREKLTNRYKFRVISSEIDDDLIPQTVQPAAGGGFGDVPVASTGTLGCVKVGSGLSIRDGVLNVDTATVVSQDNTKPVTSGAVYTEIGNIAVLLAAL